MKATEIIDKLVRLHRQGSNNRYVLENVYVYWWESDVFIQRSNGYCIEIEVKISRSDFFADFKKTEKHKILTGKLEAGRPNKFYYCCPKDLIKVDEVPSYAGLIYINDVSLTTVKEAPFLHKTKGDYSAKLCERIYHKWLKLRYENRELKRTVNN